MERFSALSLFGGGSGSCCVRLSVTWITLCVEELTDGESNRGILVWRVHEGQNIRIKLLVPRAILSETVAVSGIFTAWLSEWMKAPPTPPSQLGGRSRSHACFMMLRCPGHNTLHKLQHELFFSSVDVNHGPSAPGLRREAFREQYISSKKLMFSKPLLNSTYHLLRPRIESAIKSDVF